MYLHHLQHRQLFIMDVLLPSTEFRKPGTALIPMIMKTNKYFYAKMVLKHQRRAE
jgi:hypothetical protein